MYPLQFQMVESELKFYSLKTIINNSAKRITKYNKYHRLCNVFENATPYYYYMGGDIF